MTEEPKNQPPVNQTVSGDEETQQLPIAKQSQREDQPGSGEKYEILRELGKGGFAWVYLVRNVDLDRLEAIKILSSKLVEEEDVTDRFVKEARISAGFNHQNIVTVYEVQKNGRWSNIRAAAKIIRRHQEPFVYFTMSFIEGDTATNLIKNQKNMLQKTAVKIAMDTCKALDYAHGKGVVHRDIKPDNILVDRNGHGIVTDFGIAKVANQTRLTAVGTFMGTARYVSPEQALGQEIDGRSDIYSLGIALYEMVTGQVPFDSEQWMTVLYLHINEVPKPPDTFKSDIDRDLQAVILRMLEKKPERRYQTARELGDVLTRVYAKLGGPDVSTEAMDKIKTRADYAQAPGTEATMLQRERKPPVRSKPIDVAVAQPTEKKKPLGLIGLLVAVLLLVGFFVLRPDPPEPTPDPLPPARGTLLVSSFPTGQVVKIENAQGQDIQFDRSALPQLFELDEGEYTVIISYGGLHQKSFAYVDQRKPARVHIQFEVEQSRLLMGDL